LRGILLTGFPWGLWGYSQARNLPLAHLASLGGVYAVSLVVALAGAYVAEALVARSRAALLRVLAFAAAAHGAGAVLLWSRAHDSGEPLRVAIVQGNIDQDIKNRDLEFRNHILDRYLNLTAKAGGVDLVVWPEATFPGYLPIEIRRVPVLRFGHPLLFGVSTRERGPPLRLRNSAVWVEADGRVAGTYHKQHLVPFGEYVPLRFMLPVDKFVPGMVDFTPGDGGAPLGDPKTGVLICYDGIFPELARGEVRLGAALLANLTNDGWYGVSSAAYQHRDFYVLRAIETDRWVIRAANTGISAFVSPWGRLSGDTALNETTLTHGQVWPRQGHTPYVLLGDWLAAAATGALLGSVLLLAYRRWRGV
ncbi:MAG: apolipoprotein N-acyltransferase, partial [Deltaproteobacteria bacterium]|nr:apolipoprotein N-acyltransferase [Deltaproteobacteria bacterium]